jgi:DNA-binding cell septation regulator SpoVG
MAQISIFTIDQLTPIWPKVEAQLIEDREQFAHVCAAVEQYLAQYSSGNSFRKLILGGTTGTDLLLNKKRSIDDYEYQLYTEDSFVHANNLSNALADTVVKHYAQRVPPLIIMLKSSIPYRKYVIFVDNRPMITIYDLGRSRDQKISTTSVINPQNVASFDSRHRLLVLTAEMQLINLYRTLYTPNKAGEWELALRDENQLFHLMEKELKKQRGGADSELESELKPKPIDSNLRKTLENALLQEYVQNNPHSVLVGEHALYMILSSTAIKSHIVQVISQRTPEEDFTEITRILQPHTRAPITKHTRPLHILQDWQLSRTVIKVGDVKSGESKELMYIYNSARYDLIPFNRFLSKEESGKVNFLQIGNPFVILRFLLIDFWIVRWLTASGSINEVYSLSRQDSLREKIVALRSKLSTHSHISTIKATHIREHESTHIFQLDPSLYLGQYEDENISQKEKAKEISKKYNDYYPQDYFAKNGEYRLIGND